jgi:uncharacterized protein YyaL (SSP411 family)
MKLNLRYPPATMVVLAVLLIIYGSRSSLTAGSQPAKPSAQVDHANHLSGDPNPYVQQHAHDLVDWYPWGTEAFAKAKKENKPILVSIGFAACHWCHVMQHESFADPSTAKMMNDWFVNVVVDRQQRPDIDAICEKASQIVSGSYGWPATVFLTPDQQPFFAGTDFPAVAQRGRPSFKTLLTTIHKDWLDNHNTVLKNSNLLVSLVGKTAALDTGKQRLDDDILRYAVMRLLASSDAQLGGILGADSRKFPIPEALSLAMRLSRPDSGLDAALRDKLKTFVTVTLNNMYQGSIQDQIGGGFFRYGNTRKWDFPHFEKMLPDNAMNTMSFIDGYRLTGDKDWRQAAQDALEFALTELSTKDGAFASSLDADSAGKEGSYYLLSYDDVVHSLGAKDAQWVASVYGVTSKGNFEPGRSVPRLADMPANMARAAKLTESQFQAKLQPYRAQLKSLRAQRVKPRRDDNEITGWNGLMISALVQGYRAFGQDKYLDAGKRTMRLILDGYARDGRLRRSLSRPVGQDDSNSAYLDDYAYTIQALIDLSAADPDPIWLTQASALTEKMQATYADKTAGYSYTMYNQDKQVFSKAKPDSDQVMPSAVASAVFDLLELSRLTSKPEYAHQAESTLELYSTRMQQYPVTMVSSLLIDLQESLHPGSEIVLCADSSSTQYKPFLQMLGAKYEPASVMLFYDQAKFPDKTLSTYPASKLLEGKPSDKSKPSVYICKNNVCLMPITDVRKLEKALP